MRPSSPPLPPPPLLPTRLHHLVHLFHLLASTTKFLQLTPLLQPPQPLQLTPLLEPPQLLQLTRLLQLNLLLNLASRAAVSAAHNSERKSSSWRRLMQQMLSMPPLPLTPLPHLLAASLRQSPRLCRQAMPRQLLSTPPPPLIPLPHLLAASLRRPRRLRQCPRLCRQATPRQLLLTSLWEFHLPGLECPLSCLRLMRTQPQQWPQLATLSPQVLMLGCRLQFWTSLRC